jgi:MtN3 and saliva related transmembrane protein
MATALGIAAASWAVLMGLSPILQIREILRRRSSEGVSVGYFAILLVGFALWIAYGVASHDVPLIVPNCVALAVTACTITIARAHR